MAEKKWVQAAIRIPNGAQYSREEKVAIANEILLYIRSRSENGRDKNESAFPTYSKGYTNSLDFKNAKGRSTKVNLTLSGDMLAALDVIDVVGSKVVIGYDPSSPEADRAEGNIRGTYGQKRGSKDKARDFLGIDPKVLEGILKTKFPLSNDLKREKNTQKNITALDEAGLLNQDLLDEGN